MVVPSHCLFCGSSYKGGHAEPGEEMLEGLRVFYDCGASLSFQVSGGAFQLRLGNCGKSMKRIFCPSCEGEDYATRVAVFNPSGEPWGHHEVTHVYRCWACNSDIDAQAQGEVFIHRATPCGAVLPPGVDIGEHYHLQAALPDGGLTDELVVFVLNDGSCYIENDGGVETWEPFETSDVTPCDTMDITRLFDNLTDAVRRGVEIIRSVYPEGKMLRGAGAPNTILDEIGE